MSNVRSGGVPRAHPERGSGVLLEGRVALVTGAGSGIGRATALRFSAEGATVFVNDVTDEAARRTVDEIEGPEPAYAVAADVSDSAAVDAMVAEVEARTGRIDVLVNVAGIPWSGAGEGERFNETLEAMMGEMAAGGPPSTRWDMLTHITDESFTRMLAVHLCGSFYTIRAAAPGMMRRESGSIVNFASGAAVTPMPGSPHYSAAKAGVLGMTRSLAGELGAYGIRVNAVAPGAVLTPMTATLPPAFTASAVLQYPLGRAAQPEEIASVVLFLAADESSYMTGQTLEPNGGMHM
jgi:NAD(P)-dependent dehydrogenase (short-subunit alcohol dehydrogenase family)